MIEVHHMRATGGVAAKSGDFLGGEKLGHAAQYLSAMGRLCVCLSYVIPEGAG